MTHSYGQRRRTRHKFRKGFAQKGAIHIAKTLTTYRIGDIVDIVVDGSIHKGMPYKFYHGRTGRVFNVNPRAIGVIVNKQIRQRIIPKRIHVRVEHLKLSTSRSGFLDRIRENDKVQSLPLRKRPSPTSRASASPPRESSPSPTLPSTLPSPTSSSSTPSSTSKSSDYILFKILLLIIMPRKNRRNREDSD
jgi:large subunit ribosomal protein L21e